MTHFTNLPCASPGLDSYRALSNVGWIMIGAKDDIEARKEAYRSCDYYIRLEKWVVDGYYKVSEPEDNS